MSIRNTVLAAAILAAVAGPALAAQSLTKRAVVAREATVEVSNVQGSVDITAWDRNEVELVAVLESDKDKLTFEATDRHVLIEVDRPRGKYGRSDEEDAILTLRVPKGVRLIIDTVSADINVNGVRGQQDLESVSGDVDTQAFDASVSLSSVSGDVTVTGQGGRAVVSTENVSGSVTASGLRGDYRGEVVSGNINAEVAAVERLIANSVSGDIEVRAALAEAARVDMESISGTVTLTVKPPINSDFDLESFSGDIDNCFGHKPRDTSKYTPGSELSFTQGSGGARVEIQTLSGEISVCDR